MTERIDHAAEARKHIEWAHDQQSEEGQFDFTVRDNALIAQAEATLALVEQQRVANLIALSEMNTLTHDTIYARNDRPEGFLRDWRLRPEIAAALGVEVQR